METARRASDRVSAGARPRFLAFTLLSLVFGGLGCAPREPAATGLIVDASRDAHIRREVEARLGAEPSIAAGDIRVEVRGATVALHGSVRGIGAWQCALRNASLVDGVARVADYLLIERGPREVTCLAPRRLGERGGAASAHIARTL